MKKLLLLLIAAITTMTFAPCASAADPQIMDKLNEELTKMKIVDPTSTDSHEDGVFEVTFRVRSKFDEPYAKEHAFDKTCAAVRISTHYVLASMVCIGYSNTSQKTTYMGAGEPPAVTQTPVAYRIVDYATIEGQKISAKNIFTNYDARVILLRWDDKNAKLKKELSPLPIPNLFIPKNPQSLKTTFDDIVVNRNRFPNVGRTTADVDIATICTATRCFQVEWKAIDAQTGSPIFGLLDNNNQEFLLGFNAAEPIGSNRQSGKTYFLLTDKLVPFLRQVMDEQEFNNVQRKIVDETFFK